MKNKSVKRLRKLCLAGVITTLDYWKLKKVLKKKYLTKKTTYKRKPFLLYSFTRDECLLLFRFTHQQIHRLSKALKVPALCKLPNRIKFSGIEGICILLRRLSYPNRLSDLVKTFNRDPGTLSRIFSWMLNNIYTNNAHVISSLRQPWLTLRDLEHFSERCTAAGSLFPNVVGFIDGTSRGICRPSRGQRDQYSGYKKQHVVKYQSVVFPNGLIGRLDGPFNGRRHDSAILHLSYILEEIKQNFICADGSWFTLYGDPGYSNQKFIKVGYKNYTRLTDNQKKFNADMSAIRVSVEYGFGKIIQNFAFLDFKKNQKLMLQDLKKQYIVAAILTNCHTCLNGSQVAKYFSCSPPKLEDYLK